MAWEAEGVGGDAARRRFVAGVAEALDLVAGESIFDVACGAGDFLHPLQAAGCRVGGLDPSAELIAVARERMPDGQWLVGSADTLDPAEPYDVVVACGAFQRFPDHECARGVLARMTAKATRAVAILDVPDVGAQEAAVARGHDPAALTFERLWFLRMLNQMGASAVQIGYRHEGDHALGEHRFHVLARV